MGSMQWFVSSGHAVVCEGKRVLKAPWSEIDRRRSLCVRKSPSVFESTEFSVVN